MRLEECICNCEIKDIKEIKQKDGVAMLEKLKNLKKASKDYEKNEKAG